MQNTSDTQILTENFVVTTTGETALEGQTKHKQLTATATIVAGIVAFAVLCIILLQLGLIQSFAKKYASKAPGVLGDLLEYLATRPSIFRKKQDFCIIRGDERFDLTPLYNYLCLNDYLEMEGMLVKVNSFSMEEKAFKIDLVGFSEGQVVDIEPSGGVIVSFGNFSYVIKMPATTDLIKAV